MKYYIRKSTGEKQRFDLDKFRRSLFKAGAKEKEVEYIVNQILEKHPKSTKKIHELTTQLLQEKAPAVADRYNLKRALMELGPDGYPFEQFVAQLFARQGYTVETNVVVPGACVDHEIDIMPQKDSQHFLIECKFHNRPGLKSDVKTTLYVQARFEDIHDAWEKDPEHLHAFHQAWIATNTKFTTVAIEYARCKNMKLIGWAYPEKENIATLIQKYDLFPITTLTGLSRAQKRFLLKKGLVMCRDVHEKKHILKQLGLSQKEINKIAADARAICLI